MVVKQWHWLILGWLGSGLWMADTSTCAGSQSTRVPLPAQPPPRESAPLPDTSPLMGLGQTIRALLPLQLTAPQNTQAIVVLREADPQQTHLALWRWTPPASPQIQWQVTLPRWQRGRTPTLQRRLLQHDDLSLYLGRTHDHTLDARNLQNGALRWQITLPKPFDWSLYIGLFVTPQGPILFLQHPHDRQQQRILALSKHNGTIRWEHTLQGGALRAPQIQGDHLYLQQPRTLHRFHLQNGGLRSLPLDGRLYIHPSGLWGFRWEEQSKTHLWSRYDTHTDQWNVVHREGNTFAISDLDPHRVLVGMAQDALWIGNNGSALPCRKLRVFDLQRPQKKEIALPAGYAVSNFYDTWGQLRPTRSAWGTLPWRFFPLWLRQLADPQQKRLAIIDTQTRRIHWLSRPHRIPSTLIAGDILRDSYHFLIPLPWENKRRLLLLLDARRGTFRGAWQIEDPLQQLLGDFPSIHPDQLDKGVLYASTGRAWWSLDLEAGRFLFRQHKGLALRSFATQVQQRLGTWPPPLP